MKVFEMFEGAESPAFSLWWTSSQASLIDFSSGYTFVVTVGKPGETAVLTASSGVTGAAGSGVEPSGVPNISISRSATTINALTVPTGLTQVTYHLYLRATTAGGDRDYPGDLAILIKKRPT